MRYSLGKKGVEHVYLGEIDIINTGSRMSLAAGHRLILEPLVVDGQVLKIVWEWERPVSHKKIEDKISAILDELPHDEEEGLYNITLDRLELKLIDAFKELMDDK